MRNTALLLTSVFVSPDDVLMSRRQYADICLLNISGPH